MIKPILIAAFLLGASFRIDAQGYIVPNGVVDASQPPSSITIIDVIKNPTNSDYTAAVFIPENAETFSFQVALDQGVRVFLVLQNDPISLKAIQTQAYTELLFPNNYVFDQGVRFYLGLYTGHGRYDSNGNDTGIYSDPVFGWVQLENVGGALKFLGGEAEIGGGGIFAGTQTIIPVPEPSLFALAVLGVIGAFVHCRAKSDLQPRADIIE